MKMPRPIELDRRDLYDIVSEHIGRSDVGKVFRMCINEYFSTRSTGLVYSPLVQSLMETMRNYHLYDTVTSNISRMSFILLAYVGLRSHDGEGDWCMTIVKDLPLVVSRKRRFICMPYAHMDKASLLEEIDLDVIIPLSKPKEIASIIANDHTYTYRVGVPTDRDTALEYMKYVVRLGDSGDIHHARLRREVVIFGKMLDSHGSIYNETMSLSSWNSSLVLAIAIAYRSYLVIESVL